MFHLSDVYTVDPPVRDHPKCQIQDGRIQEVVPYESSDQTESKFGLVSIW